MSRNSALAPGQLTLAAEVLDPVVVARARDLAGACGAQAPAQVHRHLFQAEAILEPNTRIPL